MSEYIPDLGTSPGTVQMYDKYFSGAKGAIFKQRVEEAARQVGLNPGLLAANLLAEFKADAYTKTSGEVEGWGIGVDDYTARQSAIKARVPAAVHLKPTRFTSEVNEMGRAIPKVPVFRAQDAVLASAVYLKYSETQVRDAFAAMGGSFDRLPVEYQFAFTRYTMNAGAGAMRKRAAEFLGMVKRDGKFSNTTKRKDFLQYKSGVLKDGIEKFNAHKPQRAATAHTAQAIHLSQHIFGINPAGTGDSLLLVR